MENRLIKEKRQSRDALALPNMQVVVGRLRLAAPFLLNFEISMISRSWLHCSNGREAIEHQTISSS